MSEIFTVKNLCSRKSEPKFTKIGEDLLRTNAFRLAKYHRARSNGKVLQIFTAFIFGALAGPPVPKFTNLDNGAATVHRATINRATVSLIGDSSPGGI